MEKEYYSFGTVRASPNRWDNGTSEVGSLIILVHLMIASYPASEI
jgi:hypothetical protein